MGKVIVINPELCTGCRICELVCSAEHQGAFIPSLSRITVVRLDKGLNFPILCLQCQDPPCAAACPQGAIFRDDSKELVLVNEKACIGCKYCIYCCPFGGMGLNFFERKIIKCDLCKGEAKCVKACPTGALEFLEITKEVIQRRKEGISRVAKLLREA